MPRSEKKTRIKGIPPRVLLTQVDSTTGSYPQAHHGNLVGISRLTPFVDTNMMPFTSSIIYYGLGVPSASIYIPSLLNLTTSLTGSGRVRAGLSDTFLDISKCVASRSYSPFRDSGQQAADKRASIDPFWTTGSNIDGFTAPLWSKNKIEIDFSPLTASSLTGSRGGQASSYMGYYNFVSKKWDAVRPPGITTGKFDPGGVCSSSVSPDYFQQLIGFSPSHNTAYGPTNNTIPTWAFFESHGRPVSTLGFPFCGLFEATSSNTIAMSNYIDRPFLVEKIYVEMSVSFNLSTLKGTLDAAKTYNGNNFYDSTVVSSSYVINNLFLLNQRKSPLTKNLDLFQSEFNQVRHLVYSSSNTIRDLIGWFDIASYNKETQFLDQYNTNPEIFNRDVTIQVQTSNTSTTSSWNQYLVMSGAAKSPNATRLGETLNQDVLLTNKAVYEALYRRTASPIWMTQGWWGGRHGMGPMVSSGRDFFNPNKKFFGNYVSPGGDYEFQLASSSSSWETVNPYILMPGDSLILGWQLPTHDDISGALNSLERYPTGSFVEFPVAPAKLILYGSYLSEGKAVNDTLTQVLTSNSVHEEIG